MQEVMYLHLLRLRKHECIHGGSMIIELWLDTLYKRSAETALFLSLQLLQTDLFCKFWYQQKKKSPVKAT